MGCVETVACVTAYVVACLATCDDHPMSRQTDRDTSKENAKMRAALKRARDQNEALPDGRAIERALAESLKEYLARVHGGDMRKAVDCPVIRSLLNGLMKELARQRYDMRHLTTIRRIRHRLGLNQETVAVRPGF